MGDLPYQSFSYKHNHVIGHKELTFTLAALGEDNYLISKMGDDHITIFHLLFFSFLFVSFLFFLTPSLWLMFFSNSSFSKFVVATIFPLHPTFYSPALPHPTLSPPLPSPSYPLIPLISYRPSAGFFCLFSASHGPSPIFIIHHWIFASSLYLKLIVVRWILSWEIVSSRLVSSRLVGERILRNKYERTDDGGINKRFHSAGELRIYGSDQKKNHCNLSLSHDTSMGVSEWANKRLDERNGAQKRSEQCRASKWVSGANENDRTVERVTHYYTILFLRLIRFTVRRREKL